MSSILLTLISIHRAIKMLNIGVYSQNKSNQVSLANEMNTIDMNTVETKIFETSNVKIKISRINSDKDLCSKNENSISNCSFNRKESRKKSKRGSEKKAKMNVSNNCEETITADELSKKYQKTSDEESSKTDECSELKIFTSSTSAKVSFKIHTNNLRKKSHETIKLDSKKSSSETKSSNEVNKQIKPIPNCLGAKSSDSETKNSKMSKLAPESQQLLNKKKRIIKCYELATSCITADILMLIAFIFLSLMNIHFLVFLKVYKIDFLDFLNAPPINSEKEIGDGFKVFLNEKNFFNLKKCFAKSGTFYEQFLKTKWFLVDMSVYSLLPLISMFVSSGIIWMKFKKINENYSRFISNESNTQHNKSIYFKKIKRNRQICLIILNSSAYFFFSMGFYWMCFLIFHNSVIQNEFFNELQSFVYIFLYTNNAFDFVIYGFSSSAYRAELYKTLSITKRSYLRSVSEWISTLIF